MHIHLHDLVATAASRWGDAPALTARARTLGYDELWSAVAGFGAALQSLGVGRGERVAIHLDKRIETVVAIFGASVADCAFVPINPLLRAPQVRHIVADSGARVLITTSERLGLLGDEIDALDALAHVVLVGGERPAGSAALRPTVHAWDALADGRAPSPPAAIDLDTAAILYTSGSTGRPKGVVLSHRNLLAGAVSVCRYLRNDEHDCILAALPLSFDAGFSQLTTGFLAGAHVVLLDYLLPGDVVRSCAAHGVTGLTGVPPLWIQLAEQSWPPEVTERMRYVANTGGRLPRVTLDRMRATFPNAEPFLMYGLTEAFRSTYLDPAEVEQRPDSIGKAIPNAEILVVRADGRPCGPGEEGELVHRGALVAKGYWNDPERTAERFRPLPWDRTGEPAVFSGDLVVRDDDGFLYFVGRNDEMIKTSGYRVSPTEVEEAAHATGLVRDAVALGVEDPRLGQQIVLVVSPPEGAELDPDALRAELRRQLPGYMVPRRLHVRPALPRNPNGKLDRTQVRAEVTQP